MSSGRAEQLAQMAFGAQAFIPGRGGALQAWFRQTLDKLRHQARAGRRGVLEVTNAFGLFQFEALSVQAGVDGGRGLVVRVTRLVPVKSRLFHSPAFRALPLREKQAVLALVDGASTSALATTLGVAQSTALTWIGSLYSRFGVSRRSESWRCSSRTLAARCRGCLRHTSLASRRPSRERRV